MNETIRNIGILLGVAVGGIGLGYYFAPDKVRIEERVIEKEKTTKEEYKKKTKKYDKDGKVIEESEETGNKTTESNTTKKETIKEISKDQKHYAVKGGVVIDPKNLSGNLAPRLGGELRLPFFNSWIGAEVDINIKDPKVGTYLRMEF